MATKCLPLLLLLAVRPTQAALTVGAFGNDDLVKRLRSSIFVETAFLEDPWRRKAWTFYIPVYSPKRVGFGSPEGRCKQLTIWKLALKVKRGYLEAYDDIFQHDASL